MNKEEQLTYADENCICYRCPTYINAREKKEVRSEGGDKVVKDYTPKALGEEEIAYCQRGKSKIISKEINCNCTGTGFAQCPVRLKLGLKEKYYCTQAR